MDGIRGTLEEPLRLTKCDLTTVLFGVWVGERADLSKKKGAKFLICVSGDFTSVCAIHGLLGCDALLLLYVT
ncbi:hypothetical protein CEXT_443221 [Caerostris extrusa]|uniref:Uncharacterized protein n=1 Tax=Caerostris extrusa TaxID=172846 RepID=A0AAV4REU5_CAEEX|nr:hypothetical protein CEXT_443221 [Caerostris extrusa]